MVLLNKLWANVIVYWLFRPASFIYINALSLFAPCLGPSFLAHMHAENYASDGMPERNIREALKKQI